jgi:hypothetical protein
MPNGPGRVLAAEDNAVNNKLMPRLLKKTGFPVAVTLDRRRPRRAEAAESS